MTKPFGKILLTICGGREERKKDEKNPAYGRQSISRPVRIVAPIYHSRVDQEYPKTIFFEKRKKLSKTQKLKNV